MRSTTRLTIVITLTVTLTAVASPTPILVDDFESYWGWPPFLTAWTDASTLPSNAFPTLQTSDAPQGTAFMEVDFHVEGGWVNPTDSANYDSYDNASVGNSLGPFDLSSPDMELHFTMMHQQNLTSDAMFVTVDFSGSAVGLGWIPTSSWIDSWIYWWEPAPHPAVLASPGWTPSTPGYIPGTPIIYADEWNEVVFTPDMMLSGFISQESIAADMNAVNFSIAVHTWGDETGASGPYKLDGTNQIWPAQALDTTISFDNIYIVPEPMTIALLGLGGLALLRRKHQRTK